MAELINGMPCGDDQRLQLMAHVDKLLAERRCVILADDLECLDVQSRELVIAKLTGATSVYFTVSPWRIDEVDDG